MQEEIWASLETKYCTWTNLKVEESLFLSFTMISNCQELYVQVNEIVLIMDFKFNQQ